MGKGALAGTVDRRRGKARTRDKETKTRNDEQGKSGKYDYDKQASRPERVRVNESMSGQGTKASTHNRHGRSDGQASHVHSAESKIRHKAMAEMAEMDNITGTGVGS